jgi:hypothetical protein
MGLHGKKKRRASKGEKNATPSPPFVIASKTPCEAVMTHSKDALAYLFAPAPSQQESHCSSNEQGKQERMSQPAMSPQVAIMDSETEAHHIDIGQR